MASAFFQISLQLRKVGVGVIGHMGFRKKFKMLCIYSDQSVEELLYFKASPCYSFRGWHYGMIFTH